MINTKNNFQWLAKILFVFSIFLAVGLVFEVLLIDHHVQDQRLKATNQLSEIKSNVEKAVSLSLNLVEGLTAVISTKPDITQQEFSKYGEEILRKNPALRNIAAAPDLVIRLMHPVKGNEAAIGLDYRKNDKQKEAALKVIEAQTTVIAGPLKLVQGGTAFIARTPVYAIRQNEIYLWGLISSVLDVDKFYEIAGLRDKKLQLDIAIRGRDSTGKGGETFYGDPSLFSADVVDSTINLPYGSWYIVGIPTSGWSKSYEYQAVFRSGYLIIILIISYLYSVNRINQSKRTEAEIHARQAEIEKEVALESSELKSRFLANMSHELRTPMHAILSFSNLGLKRAEDEKVKDYLQKIQISGIRLTKLLDDLLDLSKMESGKLIPKLDETDFTSTMLDAIDEVSSLANEKSISVDINTDKALMGSFDKSLIIRVIINTLSNAIKFSEDRTTISINVGKDSSGKMLCYSITDEGIGIPAGELEDVFDSFIQSSKTRSEISGTGLGLPISKEIILLHQGRIWAESPPRGKHHGTRFVFEIPVGL